MVLITRVLCACQCHKGKGKVLKGANGRDIYGDESIFYQVSAYIVSTCHFHSALKNQGNPCVEEPWRLKEAPTHPAVYMLPLGRLLLRTANTTTCGHLAFFADPSQQKAPSEGCRYTKRYKKASICRALAPSALFSRDYIPILWIYSSILTV